MDVNGLTAFDWSTVVSALEEDHSQAAFLSPVGRLLTRGELLSRRRDWHETLTQTGLSAGHRVATLLPSGVHATVALFSLVDRVSLFPLNAAAKPAQIADILEDAEADVVITTAELADELRDSIGDAPTQVLTLSGQTGLNGNAVGTPRHPRDIGLVLQTSGSTGTPKRVPLSTERLVRSAQNIALHLHLGPDDCAINALPMFKGGAMVDLLAAPFLTGGSVMLARDASARALIEAIDAGGTWLQLVPAALAHLVDALDDATAKRIGDQLKFIRMISSDLPETLRQKAEDKLGVPVIQIYGMTETAGQIASNPLPPAPRKPLSVGPAAGPELAIFDEFGAQLPQGTEGEICVRGDTVMSAYEGKEPTPRYGGWLRTGDVGSLDEDGYLFITGRVKEIINRGGEKISPATVERAALKVPGVLDAVAYAVPHPTLGEQVGLSVVAENNANETYVIHKLTGLLSSHELPRKVHFVSTLPKLASGKVDRLRAASAAAQEHAPLDARTGITKLVSDLWVEVLDSDPPHLTSDFFDEGGDSLSAATFLLELEKRLGRSIPSDLLAEAPRFAALIDRLDTGPRQPGNGPPWTPFLRRETADWEGQRVGPHEVVVAQKPVATGTKIIVGDHGKRTGTQIGRVLAANHPVYLFRSLKGWADDYRDTYEVHADFYAREFAAILAPNEEVICAGYGDGGDLTMMVAERLAALGHPIRLFIAFDMILKRRTTLPILYVGSHDANQSLTGRFTAPTRAAPVMYPGGFDVIACDLSHDDLLGNDNLGRLEAQISPYLKGDKVPERHGTQELIAFEFRTARHSAEIRARLPHFLNTERARNVKVSVTNTSAGTWPPTETSGLYLAADFRSLRHKPYRFNQSRTPLAEPLAPGQTVSLEIPLLWPDPSHTRPLFLRLAMVDDGYTRFGISPSRYVFRR